MKFTDGYWQMRPGVTALSPRSIAEIVVEERRMVAHTPTRVVETRGDTLNCPALTITVDSPAEGVIGVTIEHWDQPTAGPAFALSGGGHEVRVVESRDSVSLTSGTLTARHSAGTCRGSCGRPAWRWWTSPTPTPAPGSSASCCGRASTA